MSGVAIAQPRSLQQAGRLLVEERFPLKVLKAGGLDVLDHVKEGLLEPDLLVNIRRLRTGGAGQSAIVMDGRRIVIEATTTLEEIARSPLVRTHAPVVAQALESAATPQIRHVATAAGNLLQRPRCWYYRREQFHCLKKGGHHCFAAEGENKFHAVFGDGPCHIVHPSNLAPALAICDGTMTLIGGDRDSIDIRSLYHLPEDGIRSEHNLEAAEVATAISFERAPRSGFYAVKEKQSFDWPLVAAAVSLELSGTRIESARVCAGAVAPVPWPLPAVERRLAGTDVDDTQAVRDACLLAIDGAKPMSQNRYKLRLLPVAVHRAVLKAAGRQEEAWS